MIHEMVHAYLNVKYSNFMSFDNGLDFKLKMDEYAKDNGITDINSNEFHHEFMGQYVDAMAISLVDWDVKYGTGGIYVKDSNGNNVKDSNGDDILDWEYYRSMAFGGLFQIDTSGNIVSEIDSFKALVPDSNKRKEIAKKILNEQKGNTKAKGTKCN
mgnify:FL=1